MDKKMSDHKCVIAIPVYRVPLEMERKSFRQCLKVLANYDIAIVTHSGVDLAAFNDMAAEYKKPVKVELFDAHYFAGISGYNSLCMDKAFYERFVDSYEYMLIYQLDAWTFGDQLQDWCDKGYDYVGSPFFFYDADKHLTTSFVGVGNGGLSLRRLQYCIDVLNLPRHLPYLTPAALFKRCSFAYRHLGWPAWKTLLRIAKYSFVSLGWHNTLSWLIRNANEDYVLSHYAQNSWFLSPNLPSPEEAARFSFEVNPSFLYDFNGKVLPFGCHAFEKYEYETFWKNFIESDATARTNHS